MNKKGFTLVELLAVIVILAIIALIVTPVVGNIITSARIAANARSVEGHIRNVELVIMTKAFNEETGDLTAYDIEGSGLPSSIQASLPNNDDVVCTSYMVENGTVTMALWCYSNRDNWKEVYSYSNVTGANITNDFKGTYVASSSSDTHRGIVYIDPSDLSKTCTSTSTLTTTTTGCKKFYIYDDTGSTYKMIMDRSIAARANWISESDYIAAGGTKEEFDAGGYGSYDYHLFGPITINKKIASLTTGWIGNPRLITADEVAHIIGADREDTIKWDSSKQYSLVGEDGNFDIDTQFSWFYLDGGYNEKPNSYSNEDGWQKRYCDTPGCSNFYWLYDYVFQCTGCNVSAEQNAGVGYWVDSQRIVGNPFLLMNRNGKILNALSSQTALDENSTYGIRVVITLPKSLINS